MAGRIDWKLGDQVLDGHKAHTTHCDISEETNRLFIITVVLSDEVYALNVQCGPLRKNSLSYKRDIFIMTTQKPSYTKHSPLTPSSTHTHIIHQFIISI